MGAQRPIKVFSRAGPQGAVRPALEPTTLADELKRDPSLHGALEESLTGEPSHGDSHLALKPLRDSEAPGAPSGPGEEEPPRGSDGLGHSGGPDEEEVIVIEEPESVGPGPRVVRVPRTPTQKEIDDHNVTHLPHEEWCEFCMSGRARNKPHRKKGHTRSDRDGDVVGDSEVLGAPSGPDMEESPKPGPTHMHGLLLRVQWWGEQSRST